MIVSEAIEQQLMCEACHVRYTKPAVELSKVVNEFGSGQL